MNLVLALCIAILTTVTAKLDSKLKSLEAKQNEKGGLIIVNVEQPKPKEQLPASKEKQFFDVYFLTPNQPDEI
jgi:hypothetical protein